MIACRGDSARKRRLLLTVSAAALWTAGIAPSWAQLGPPVRLAPRVDSGEPAPTIRPREPEPETPAIRPPAENRQILLSPFAPRSEPQRSAPATIEVEQPRALDKDAAGVDTAGGALPDTLWRGSNRALVDRLIADIPAPNNSTAGRSLAVRVLTSGGAPPVGEVQGADGDKRSFVGRRAEKLMALGDTADALALARSVPAHGDDESLSRVVLDGAWIAFDDAAACAETFTQIAQFDEPYRQKALVYCQASKNDKGRAQLGLRMLREQQADEDPAFDRLIALVLGDTKVPVDSLRGAAPLHIAMARAAKQQLPADTVQGAPPAVLAMIAGSSNAAADLRIAAAERAEAAGAIPTAVLAQLYDGATLRAEDLTRAIDIASRDRGARGRMIVYRAVKAAAPGAARLALLARGLGLARERGEYAQAARLNAPMLLEVAPDASQAAYCGDAVRALLLTRHSDEAHRWFETASAAAAGDAASADAVALAWPMLRIAGEAGDVADGEAAARLAAWRAAQQRLNPAAAPANAALLAVILSALGDRGASDLVAQAASAPATPRPAAFTPPLGAMIGLGEAAAGRRQGETALFALAALGNDGPASLDPLSLSRVLDALRAVGLVAEARSLALEAAILGGL